MTEHGTAIDEQQQTEQTEHELPETLDSEELPSRPQEPTERLVPVSEARRYRRRAQTAEQRVRELESDLHEGQEQLAQREQQLDELATKRAIDIALQEHDVVDAEVATLLIQQQLEDACDGDVEQAVCELRRRKPFLFRPQRTQSLTTALGPYTEQRNGHGGGRMEHAAEEAIRSGRRGDLLQYLRLRRSQK